MCILDNNPLLLDVSFKNIFSVSGVLSHSLGTADCKAEVFNCNEV